MSSTFKFHSTINEVVPWQAQYAFPTQSTKIAKQTVKLVPKNGTEFKRNNIIRIEFPAENYLNVLNSVLQFDLSIGSLTAIYAGSGISIAAAVPANAVNNMYSFRFKGWAAFFGTTAEIAASVSTVNYYAGHPCSLTVGGVTHWNVITKSECINPDEATAANREWRLSFARAWPAVAIAGGVFSIFPKVELQNGGAHNVFSRLRVLYGSMVIEDIQEYSTLVRLLTECAVQRDYGSSHGQILDGMTSATPLDHGTTQTGIPVRADEAMLNASVVNQLLMLPGRKRTFCLNLLSGLLTQKKLVPLKWMASQLVIELTVNPEGDALIGQSGADAALASTPDYTLTDVNYIAELLEFDSAFDTAFWGGLQQMGVPLKFASWHFHSFPITGGNQTFQIHERSRSVKAAFAVARTSLTSSINYDSDRFFNDLGATFAASGRLTNGTQAPVETFQYRVGGRYYPAQPVRCLYGAAEAYVELSKALDNLGDYTRGSQISAYRWASYADDTAAQYEQGGEAFIMSASFENTDVSPGTIAGINAEEQSDIAITIKTRASTAPVNKKLDVFMYYDSLLVIRPGNNVELIM